MGQHKDKGLAALTLAEECAELIQVITKRERFAEPWDSVRPDSNMTRIQELQLEMADIVYQFNRLMEQEGIPSRYTEISTLRGEDLEVPF